MKTAATIICLVALAFVTCCQSDAQKARTLLNRALALVRSEDTERATALFEEIVREYPHTEEATVANRSLDSLRVVELLEEKTGQLREETSVRQAQMIKTVLWLFFTA